jgi:hypothetical protein
MKALQKLKNLEKKLNHLNKLLDENKITDKEARHFFICRYFSRL